MYKYSISAINFLRNRDWFGKNVEIHFNKSGGTHNTIIGAIASLLVNILVCVFFYVNLSKMIFYLDDKVSLSYKILDL